MNGYFAALCGAAPAWCLAYYQGIKNTISWFRQNGVRIDTATRQIIVDRPLP